MIDIWFIFTLFVPFLEVILHTKMETIKQEIEDIQKKPNGTWSQNQVEHNGIVEIKGRKTKNLNRLRIIATYGLPILTAIFLLLFFVIGFLLAF